MTSVAKTVRTKVWVGKSVKTSEFINTLFSFILTLGLRLWKKENKKKTITILFERIKMYSINIKINELFKIP